MCLIPCACDCIYQEDGYCTLKTPTTVTNDISEGCIYYLKKNQNEASFINHKEQQRPL